MTNQPQPPGYWVPQSYARPLPSPPRLHWGWLVLLNLITRGLFSAVWLLVQANWVRKVRGRSHAFVWAIVHICFFPFAFIAAFFVGLLLGVAKVDAQASQSVIGLLTVFVVVGVGVLYYATTYILRSELEAEPIGIPLGGVMTFFFGTIYFQYHLRDFEFTGTTSTGSGVLNLSQPPVQPMTGISEGF